MSEKDTDQSQVIQIDIRETLRSKMPRYSRFVPGWLVRWLERVICQDELNALLRAIGDKKGADASDTVLRELGITLDVRGLERLPAGRVVIASNHPLGGLDGLALISTLGHHYDGKIRFMVNDLLMAVKPLEDVFLPVNKFGKQSREAVASIMAEYRGDKQMLTFPAGLCSRLHAGGVIADLEWQKAVVSMAAHYKRDVVPVYFGGQNSRAFYRLARWRKRLGLKFNVEQIMLPAEMLKQRDARFTIVVGDPVSWQSLDTSQPAAEAARLRDLCYSLAPSDLQTTN